MSAAVTEVVERKGAPRLALTVLAAIHVTVVVWHGSGHTQLAIGLSRFQNLFVFGVILIAPVIATLLLWTPARAFALWVYTMAMFASLLFGVYYHYIAVSPDNVHYLPAGVESARRYFIFSAAAVALVELIAAFYRSVSLF